MHFDFTPNCIFFLNLGYNYYDNILKDFSKKINLHFSKTSKLDSQNDTMNEENMKNIEYLNEVDSLTKHVDIKK